MTQDKSANVLWHKSKQRRFTPSGCFPAAALGAALAVPFSIYAVLSGSGWPPGLLGAGHGHELIFGFALALVAGALCRTQISGCKKVAQHGGRLAVGGLRYYSCS
ncbi:hypothetical protein [uncultured Marinobacter sp.]|uniref:hypothetical protein n=1 Tax=uncultured Marinobacter sp. TaxID=187379 RepID=UPI0030DD0298